MVSGCEHPSMLLNFGQVYFACFHFVIINLILNQLLINLFFIFHLSSFCIYSDIITKIAAPINRFAMTKIKTLVLPEFLRCKNRIYSIQQLTAFLTQSPMDPKMPLLWRGSFLMEVDVVCP